MTMPAPLRHGLLAIAFLATYGFTYAVTPVAPETLASIDQLPMTMAPWAGRDAPPLAPEVMATLAADDYVRRYYFASDVSSASQPPARRVVEMDISYYAQPRVGANMHSPLNCLPGNGWRIARVDHVRLPNSSAADAEIRALTVERGQRKYAMAYWFQSRDRVLSGEFSTRFHLLADALRRQPTDAGLVRVMAPIAASGDAEQAVLGFAARLVPELARILKG
jgi:EpsI family protein